MNVLFLDYDGVVNTPMWDDTGKHCRFNYSRDNKVNNFQAVQWVSKFCREYGYDIVVTSTWRCEDNYKDCLVNGGLWEDVKILGRTPYVLNGERGDEIQKYLEEHPDVENFLIFDDDSDMGVLYDHLIKTNFAFGFSMYNYESAVELHNRLVDEHNTGKSKATTTKHPKLDYDTFINTICGVAENLKNESVSDADIETINTLMGDFSEQVLQPIIEDEDVYMPADFDVVHRVFNYVYSSLKSTRERLIFMLGELMVFETYKEIFSVCDKYKASDWWMKNNEKDFIQSKEKR